MKSLSNLALNSALNKSNVKAVLKNAVGYIKDSDNTEIGNLEMSKDGSETLVYTGNLTSDNVTDIRGMGYEVVPNNNDNTYFIYQSETYYEGTEEVLERPNSIERL